MMMRAIELQYLTKTRAQNRNRSIGQVGLGLLAFAAVALIAVPALAIPQFTPTSTSRLHTAGNGPGAVYITEGGGVTYTSGSGLLEIDAKLDVLNWYDPSNGSCATDSLGSNCSHDFVTNLDFHVEADFLDITTADQGFGVTQININFESTGGSDFSWKDPTDGDSIMLSGSWISGTYNSIDYSGLTASVLYNDGSVFGSAGVLGDVNVIGFASIVASPYEDLFSFGEPNVDFMLNLSELFDFTPTIDTIAGILAGGGALPSFTGDTQGEIFRVVDNVFTPNPIPEPSTALLLVAGLMALAVRRRA